MRWSVQYGFRQTLRQGSFVRETLKKSLLDFSALSNPANAIRDCLKKSEAYCRFWQQIPALRKALNEPTPV
jgi:hypothetical protein